MSKKSCLDSSEKSHTHSKEINSFIYFNFSVALCEFFSCLSFSVTELHVTRRQAGVQKDCVCITPLTIVVMVP